MNSMLVAAVLIAAGLFIFGLLYAPSQAQNITNNASGTPAPGELANAQISMDEIDRLLKSGANTTSEAMRTLSEEQEIDGLESQILELERYNERIIDLFTDVYNVCVTGSHDKETILLCLEYQKEKNKALTEFMLNHTDMSDKILYGVK